PGNTFPLSRGPSKCPLVIGAVTRVPWGTPGILCTAPTATDNVINKRESISAPQSGGDRESCGRPKYGNSSNRSPSGPTLSAVTLPFVSIEKNTSTASPVSVRPYAGRPPPVEGQSSFV